MKLSKPKTIPLAEVCMWCDLGGYEDYEMYHEATDEQLDNLREHMRKREHQLYFQALNTHWGFHVY
jgi:hypothetical protein